MKEKYEAVEQNKNGNKSNIVSSKINAEILEHIYPTPPEEQGPALMGPKSGLSFRFGKNDNKWLPFVYVITGLLAIGCLLSAILS